MGSFTLVEGGTCRRGRHTLTAENIRARPDGTRVCLDCVRANERSRKFREDKDKRRAQQRARWARKTKRERRDTHLRGRFGITVDEFEAMLARQAGACAVCGSSDPADQWGEHLHVDHDHVSGAIRGLLCQRCNVMLGNAQDDPARLRRAAAYLEEVR